MKKLFILLSIVSFSYTTKAQVGIGTTTPEADLDIRTSNATSPTAYAGIAVPQVDVLPASGNRAGQMVFLTTTKLYYYYNGSSWNSLSTQANTFGDIKHSYQNTEHNGWIPLNGTRTYASLTATQKLAADGIGLSTLPDLSDRTIVGVSGTKEINSKNSNSTSKMIARNQLPTDDISTSSSGDHTHTYANYGAVASTPVLGSALSTTESGTKTTSPSGNHSHTINLNGTGTQQPLDIQDPYIAMNAFIYLGN